MARWIKPDGTEEEAHPQNGVEFTLEEIKACLDGGYLEAVPFTRDLIMYVDEDGIRKQLPLNYKAMEELFVQTGRRVPIVGNVFIASLRETGDEE